MPTALMVLHLFAVEPKSWTLSPAGRNDSELEMFAPSSLRAESPIVFAERNFASLFAVPGPTFALEPAGPVLPLPITNNPATPPPARAVRNWRRSICLFSAMPVPSIEIEQRYEGHEKEEYVNENDG